MFPDDYPPAVAQEAVNRWNSMTIDERHTARVIYDVATTGVGFFAYVRFGDLFAIPIAMGLAFRVGSKGIPGTN